VDPLGTTETTKPRCSASKWRKVTALTFVSPESAHHGGSIELGVTLVQGATIYPERISHDRQVAKAFLGGAFAVYCPLPRHPIGAG